MDKTYFIGVGDFGFDPGPGIYVADRLPDDLLAEYVAYFGPVENNPEGLHYANILKDALNAKAGVTA